MTVPPVGKLDHARPWAHQLATAYSAVATGQRVALANPLPATEHSVLILGWVRTSCSMRPLVWAATPKGMVEAASSQRVALNALEWTGWIHRATPPLPLRLHAVAFWLADRAGPTPAGARAPYAPHNHVAESIGVGRKAVKDAMRDLEQAGWIARKRRRAASGADLASEVALCVPAGRVRRWTGDGRPEHIYGDHTWTAPAWKAGSHQTPVSYTHLTLPTKRIV